MMTDGGGGGVGKGGEGGMGCPGALCCRGCRDGSESTTGGVLRKFAGPGATRYRVMAVGEIKEDARHQTARAS